MKTEAPLLAFHGKPEIKKKYLARVRAHQKADEIISGVYWENGKGCSVGCILHSGAHANAETEIGVPAVLMRLNDRLFEGQYKYVSPLTAKAWPNRFLSAPKPGADLTMVWPRFALWLLVDETSGVIRFAKSERSREAIRGVAELYRQWCDGCKPAAVLWERARAAAATADAAATAAAAATADADAAATADAYAAATADAYAYAYAAYAYADAAATDATADAYAARKKHYLLMADKLIELMKAAK